MADVRMLFWRGITVADFFNIERSRTAGPRGGGGQSYISISFTGLDYEELGEFLGVSPPARIGSDRPLVRLSDVGVVEEPSVAAALEFAPRYLPPNTDDRYRIAKQNRQFQDRHPAWSSSRGFPEAPDNVVKRDPRIPDLTYLKVFVVRLEDGSYCAGFTNTGTRPGGLLGVPGIDILFQPFDESASAGLIKFLSGALTLDQLASAHEELSGPAATIVFKAPEVLEALDATSEAAGKAPSGQKYRANAAERRAIELHAMDVAAAALKAEGWSVTDVSATRPYDFLCKKHSQELRVEVKGTTGDGQAVLLTPGEVDHARKNHPHVRLMVVSDIDLQTDMTTGKPVVNGGDLHELNPWEIDADGALKATGYEYRFH